MQRVARKTIQNTPLDPCIPAIVLIGRRGSVITISGGFNLKTSSHWLLTYIYNVLNLSRKCAISCGKIHQSSLNPAFHSVFYCV